MALILDGYDTVYSGPHVVLVRPEWRPLLLEDLLADFAAVPAPERRLFTGRVEHFSYRPKDAPERVLVRRLARGGLARVAGDLHLGLSRITSELRAADRARKAGLRVPDILACRATRAVGPFWRFTLAVAEIEGARDLLEALPAAPPADRHRILEDVAAELRRLHQAGVYHGDLNVKNILLRGREVFLVDLDRARTRPAREPAMDESNLARLNRSVEKRLAGVVSRLDRLRFLRAYALDRAEIPGLARRCASGLWFHRLWWAIAGAR